MRAIISCRETLFSSLSKNSQLQDLLKTSQRDARSIESRALLASSNMSRRHDALQNTLAIATYLNQLIGPCEEAGVNIKAAVQFESANVLWDQGEMTASIRMLQDLQTTIDMTSDFIRIGKSELLAKLVMCLTLSFYHFAKSKIGTSDIRSEVGEARRNP